MLAPHQHQANQQNSSSSVDHLVRQTIEEVTGNALSDVLPGADLVEDLGISGTEMLKIMKKIEFTLDLEFPTHVKSELLGSVTVQDLVEIIAEEYEY